MAVSVLSFPALPALTYARILEVPSQKHEAKEPQLHNCKILKSDSIAVSVHKKANYCKKTLIICLFELICNPQAAQYYFVTQNRQ